MIFEDFIEQFCTLILNLTATPANLQTAGSLMALLITGAFLFIFLLGTKGKGGILMIVIVPLLCTIGFTFLGWYQIWIGILICLPMALGIGLLAKQSTAGE